MVTEGITDYLTWYLKNVQTSRGADALYLGLYEDTVEPVIGSTLATISEASGSGYSRIQLTDAGWTIVADTATHSEQIFTATADWTTDIYGSFICNVSTGTAGELICVKHGTSVPWSVLNTKTIAITPTLIGS